MSPTKIGVVWLDGFGKVQRINASIPSKQVSKVFLAQVAIRTTSNPFVHVLAFLDSKANSCFMDKKFAQVHQLSLRELLRNWSPRMGSK